MASTACTLREHVTLQSVCRLLLAFLLLASCMPVGGQDCSFEPVEFPIKDVSLSNGGYWRGISMAVGDPPQELSFEPIIQMDNVWLFDDHHTLCGGRTRDACITARGGLYSPEDSSALQEFGDSQEAGAQHNDSFLVTEAHWVTDDITLDPNTTLTDFPLPLTREELFTPVQSGGNVLGLGPDSTLVEALRKAKKIGSKTWSFWWGLAGQEPSNRMDGSLIVGGYDKAKIKNPDNNHTAPLSPVTRMRTGASFIITGVILNFPNGTNANLLDPAWGSTQLPALLCPQWPQVMSIPYDPYMIRLQEWTGTTSKDRSRGFNFFSLMFPTTDVYPGDLTIVLDSGFSVRIPNSQLVAPETSIGKDGQFDVDPDHQDLLFYALEGGNQFDMVCIGQYFFTSTYLMVNHDEDTFTMWEANPTSDTDLVSINTDEGCSATQEAPEPSGTDGAKSDTGHNSDMTLPIGAIVGIVIAVFAIIIGFCVFSWFWRKRRRQPRGPPTPMQQFISEKQAWSETQADRMPGRVDSMPRELPAVSAFVPVELDSQFRSPQELECPPAELGKGRRSEVLSDSDS